MQYDDDFDEEDLYYNKNKKNKYQVDVVKDQGKLAKSAPKNIEDDISSIAKKTDEPSEENEFDEDSDDMLDEMARFVEGQDLELDHTNFF